MTEGLLSRLGLTPQQVAQLSGGLRNRVVSFLLRWSATRRPWPASTS